MSPILRATFLLTMAVSFAVNTCHAQSLVSIDAADTGWYDDVGFHGPDNPNYIVGRLETNGLVEEFHNFLIFDVSRADTIVSATLFLPNTDVPNFGFESPDPTETYNLFDVTTDVSSLLDGTGGVNAFDDLGSGTIFAERVVSEADDGTFVAVDVNAAGLAALNSSNGLFAFGGALTTLRPGGTDDEVVFSASQFDSQVRLELTVIPEPAAAILVMCMGCLVSMTRRRSFAMAK